MLRLTHRAIALVTLVGMIALLMPGSAFAGTTGSIAGHVTDSQTNAPLADVTVKAVAPTQTATTVTDSSGAFRFLTLTPDTYTLSFSKDGYDQFSQAGNSVFADQMQTLSVVLVKSLRTIAKVTSRSAGDLVKAGTGSDVYSVNATMAGAAAGLTGSGSLSNAYGAIASVPGVAVDGGEQGWFQTVHIRGGDIDQVGYELDGIPVNRVYDNAPQTMLSSLGQQELQVYTGGTPASADAQGISGYINQVVKTGTYPGYANATLSGGAPTFLHGASVEAGGSTPDRNFSYYIGLGGSDQAYRYIDNSNGASDFDSFFYPINLVDQNSYAPGPCISAPVPYLCGAANGQVPGSSVQSVVYTGGNGVNPSQLFANGQAFGLGYTQQRDTLMNFHFAIPHKNGLRDDIQALYLTSEVFANYYSSQSDLGAVTNQPYYGNYTWDNSYTYNGPLMQAPNSANVIPYLYPSSGTQDANATLPSTIRDANDNGVSVMKLQYQHPFSSNSYLRVYGYGLYSNWFIYGPNTAAQPWYGAELADYEIPDHTFGANISYTNQLSDKNLLTVSYGYTGSNLQRYYVGYIHTDYNAASFVGSNGECYDPTSGAQIGCYDPSGNQNGTIQGVAAGLSAPSYNCTTTPSLPACVANANWLMTNDTFNAALNQVHTRFSGFSIGDQYRPNDKLNLNLGLRVENFRYIYGDTDSNDPARQFWFAHYNAEYCMVPGQAPFYNGVDGTPCPMVTVGSNAVQSVSPNLQNPGNVPDYVVARFEPRISLTYSLNQNNVLRASAGIYARPPNSSWVEYNVTQADLPTYLGSHFAAYGFNTPEHNIRPDTSYNYDLSWESHLKGTDISFKVTPFYRATRDQLQNFYIDPQGGLESGLNVGSQVSSGVEIAIQKGDFNRNGFAGQLSYTFTHSAIKYQNFPGQNVNVIDQLNGYIQAYNAYTKKGGGSPCYTYESNGTAGAAAPNCGPGTVANPYYGYNPQPLMDRNASYPTYDVIPGPLAGTNGYAVPHVVALLLNYKHDKFSVAPSVSFSSGAEYGAPTAWPGYNPQSCYAPPSAWSTANPGKADPASCDDFGGLPLFIPDVYTGQYDTLGQFKEPWRLTVGIGFKYDVSPKVTAHLGLVNLLDVCGQRGYSWDNPDVCVYGNLPSGIMAPEGNFYPNSQATTAPAQMKYPYSFWLNNNNTGFVGVRQPMEITGSLDFKL